MNPSGHDSAASEMIRHRNWLFAHVAIAARTKILPLDFRQPEECSADAPKCGG